MSARASQQTTSFSLPSLQSKQRFTGKHGQMPAAFKDFLGSAPATSSNSALSKGASNSHSPTAIGASHPGKLVTGIANQTDSLIKSSHSSRAKT